MTHVASTDGSTSRGSGPGAILAATLAHGVVPVVVCTWPGTWLANRTAREAYSGFGLLVLTLFLATLVSRLPRALASVACLWLIVVPVWASAWAWAYLGGHDGVGASTLCLAVPGYTVAQWLSVALARAGWPQRAWQRASRTCGGVLAGLTLLAFAAGLLPRGFWAAPTPVRLEFGWRALGVREKPADGVWQAVGPVVASVATSVGRESRTTLRLVPVDDGTNAVAGARSARMTLYPDERYRLRCLVRASEGAQLTLAVRTLADGSSGSSLVATERVGPGWRLVQRGFVAAGELPSAVELSVADAPAGVEVAELVLERRRPSHAAEVQVERWQVAGGAHAPLALEFAPERPDAMVVETTAAIEPASGLGLINPGLQLAAGRKYRLQFQALAEHSAPLRVEVQAGPDQRLVEETVNLAGVSQTTEIVFRTPAMPTEAALWLAPLGGPNVVTISGLVLEDLDPVGETELLASAWRLHSEPTCRALLRRPHTVNPTLEVRIAAPGPGQPGDTSVEQAVRALDGSARYRLSFRLRSEPPRLVTAAVTGTTPVAGIDSLAWRATTTWQDFSADVVADAAATAGSVLLNLGGAVGSVEVADVALTPVVKSRPTDLVVDEWRLAVDPDSRASLAPIDATGLLSANIERLSDDRPWRVVLSQARLAVDAWTHYVLRVRVRGSAERTVQVGLRRARDGSSLVPMLDLPVTTEWTELTRPLRAPVGEMNSELFVNLGGSTGQVEFSTIELVPRSDQPLALWPEDWRFDVVPGAQAAPRAMDSEPGQLAASISQGGATVWDVQWVQRGLRLAPRTRYRVTGRIRADALRRVSLFTTLTDNPAQTLRSTNVAATADWQAFGWVWLSGAEACIADLHVACGGQAGEVEIDTLAIVPLPVTGPTQLVDEAWQLEVDPQAAATISRPVDRPEVLHAEVTQVVAAQPWCVRLIQEGLAIEAGARYRVTFFGRAVGEPTNVDYLIHRQSNPSYLGLGGEVRCEGEWRKFVGEYTAMGSDPAARLLFNLGEVPTQVELRDILVEQVGAAPATVAADSPDAPTLDLAATLGGEQFGQWRVLQPSTKPSVALRATTPANALDVVRLEPVHGRSAQPWELRLALDAFPISAGKSYFISFRVRADRPRRVGYSLNQAHEPWEPLGAAGVVPATTRWQTVVTRFTPARDDRACYFCFNVGGHDAAVELSHFTFEPRPPLRGWAGLAGSGLVVLGLAVWLVWSDRQKVLTAELNRQQVQLSGPGLPKEIRYSPDPGADSQREMPRLLPPSSEPRSH